MTSVSRRVRQRPLAVYTDGSGINGKVGAAAVLPERQRIAQAYLGNEAAAIVYAAELQGILMVLQLICDEAREGSRWRYRRATIFTDSQAAIRAVRDPRRQSGQHILRGIVQMLHKLQETAPEMDLRIQWTPAYEGIPGNERADIAAKEATG